MTPLYNNSAHPSTQDLRSTSFMLPAPVAASGEMPPGGPPPGVSAAPTFGGLLHALRRRWLIAVPLAVVAAAGAVVAVFTFLPPQYVAVMRYRVAQNPGRGVIYDEGGGDTAEFLLFKQNQQSLVASPRVLSRALKDKLPDGKDVRDLGVVREKGADALDWLEKAIKTDYL